MLAAARLMLWTMLAWPLAAGAAGQGAARIQVTASPQALRLAEGSRATLRIAGAGGPPTLAASVGRIEGLREVSSDVYAAEYVPPDSLDPQVAVVTALSPSGFGWVAIPLSGMREVVVSARYGTPVSVSVDGEVFGPVMADAMGRAVVRVAVPPGVRAAQYGKQKMDLGAPDRSLVHVLLSSPAADANQPAEVTVRLFALTERGKPRADAPVALEASEGTLSRTVQVEPGVHEARWALVAGRVGFARVTARLQDRPTSTATATLERVPGPPHSIAISLGRDQLVAGEDEELAVTATVLDSAGNPTECPTNLVADPGQVLGWERTGRGHYEGKVQVPRRLSGRRRLEVKVFASRTLSAAREVPLLAGPPSKIQLDAEGGLRADGRPHEVRLQVLDRDGNRVEVSSDPVVVAARGEVGPPVRKAPGDYRLAYHASPTAKEFEEAILAWVGSLETESRFQVQALGGGLVLAPKVGVALGTGGLASFAGGAEIGLWARSMSQNLGLILEGQVFALSRTDSVSGLELKTEVTFVPLLASLGWRRPLKGGLLWLGAGGGAVYASSRVSGIPGQAPVSGSSWAPEVHGSAGWGWPAGPGLPFAEARVGWQADGGSGPVQGSLWSLSVMMGYRFDVL